MTSLSIYWISRLTEIKDAMTVVSNIGFTIALLCAFPYAITHVVKLICHDKDNPDYQIASTICSAAKKPMIISAIVALAVVVSNAFIPTTKEMFAIKALPEICTPANIDKAKTIMPDALDAAADYIKSLKDSK